MEIKITKHSGPQPLINFKPGQLFREIINDAVWIVTDAQNLNSIMCVKLSGNSAGGKYWCSLHEKVIPVTQKNGLEVIDN